MSDQTRSPGETYPYEGPIADPHVPEIRESETDTDEEYELARIRADRQSREARNARGISGWIHDLILLILINSFLFFLKYLLSPE